MGVGSGEQGGRGPPCIFIHDTDILDRGLIVLFFGLFVSLNILTLLNVYGVRGDLDPILIRDNFQIFKYSAVARFLIFKAFGQTSFDEECFDMQMQIIGGTKQNFGKMSCAYLSGFCSSLFHKISKSIRWPHNRKRQKQFGEANKICPNIFSLAQISWFNSQTLCKKL